VIRLDPDNYYTFSGRADARRAKGDLDGCIGDLTTAMRLGKQLLKQE
jgi:hypothetical protein